LAVSKELFGKSPAGEEIILYTLKNSMGTEVKIMNLGATIVSVLFQDKNETFRDVVLGYDCVEDYYKGGCYYGALIGRSGNRIDKARFSLNGKSYSLAVNDNENNLHSGPNGFDKRLFELTGEQEDRITLTVHDKDLEQGYPGNFCCSVTYILNEENELKLHYEAECDQDTVCNLTNHTYFNLGGQESGSILNTQLWLAAREYTPVIDGQAIPTGEYAPVAGTVFDFTTPKTIGRDIDADDPQLKYVGGYDHNFVVQREQGIDQRFAEAYNPETGICLEAFSDLPGFQFYSGNFMNDEMGKKGARYTKRCGFCLETQFYPNSINQEGFAKPILKAGSRFASTTTYRFTVK